MKLRIMTVDDSASVRMMVRFSLEAAGFEAIEAVDGLDALEKLAGTDVQAMIVDVNMPRMGGIELVRKLRRIPGHGKTPVLMLTTRENQDGVEDAKAAGADGWMVKPFSPEELVRVLERLME